MTKDEDGGSGPHLTSPHTVSRGQSSLLIPPRRFGLPSLSFVIRHSTLPSSGSGIWNPGLWNPRSGVQSPGRPLSSRRAVRSRLAGKLLVHHGSVIEERGHDDGSLLQVVGLSAVEDV